jgi:hypothetical protein
VGGGAEGEASRQLRWPRTIRGEIGKLSQGFPTINTPLGFQEQGCAGRRLLPSRVFRLSRVCHAVERKR